MISPHNGPVPQVVFQRCKGRLTLISPVKCLAGLHGSIQWITSNTKVCSQHFTSECVVWHEEVERRAYFVTLHNVTLQA